MRNPFTGECKVEQVESLLGKRKQDVELREVLAQLSRRLIASFPV